MWCVIDVIIYFEIKAASNYNFHSLELPDRPLSKPLNIAHWACILPRLLRVHLGSEVWGNNYNSNYIGTINVKSNTGTANAVYYCHFWKDLA